MGVSDTLLFACAICEHEVRDFPYRNGRERHLAPICRRCERCWSERVGKPSAGFMMDRRKAMQIFCLAEALHSTASLMDWEAKHG